MAFYNFYNNTVDINDIWYESHRSIIERVAIDCEAGDRVEELVEKFLDRSPRYDAFLRKQGIAK